MTKHPDHHVPLSDGWSVWKWVCIRGAGFPIADALSIAAPELAEKIDRSAPKEELEHEWEKTQLRVREKLLTICRRPDFLEAVIWQNRAAIHGSIGSFMRAPVEQRNSKSRQNEQLVASYLQRYATKNDTIGFFGPVGWGELSEREVSSIFAGPGLLSKRTVYFEAWGIDLLADQISKIPGLKLELAPRRMPTLWVDGTTLRHPIDRTSEVPLAYGRVLAACNGLRSAKEIANELIADPALELADESDVYEIMEELEEKKMIHWAIELPPTVDHPDQVLASILAPLGPDAHEGRAKLAELQTAKDAVAATAGDPNTLDAELGKLEALFSTSVGAAATRSEGQIYAGRTLVFEDTRRDLDLSLGRDLLDRLAPPLSLILHSARWYTHQIASRYRALAFDIYRRLRGTSPEVDYIRFWTELEPHFTGAGGNTAPEVVRQVVEELQRKWASILQVAPEEKRITRSAEAIKSAVLREFAAPHPGWPMARFHSPDLFVSAASVEALKRGEVEFVLGEIHPGTNTCLTPVLLRQHPHPEELVRAYEADVPVPSFSPVIPKERSNRANPYSSSSKDYELELGETRSVRPRDHVVTIGELFVSEVEGKLMMCSRDGARRFDATEFLAHFMLFDSQQRFVIIPPLAHTPRVAIDALVVSRERWRVPAKELAFAALEAPLERMIGARAWKKAMGMPRFVYAKVPEEPKPTFVDFDSPPLIEVLAKSARKASTVTISEMLPGPESTWLPDAQGKRYTCELRIAAIDPLAWTSD